MAVATRPPELDDPDAIFALYVKRGLTTHEIAERLSCSPATVKRALHRQGWLRPRPRGPRPRTA
jgi:DNA-directed RNA polymerase specialized sigma24 family protein